MDGLGVLAIDGNSAHLVRAATAGDAAAFDRLVEAHAGQVYRLALRMLGSRQDAEDVQQDTFRPGLSPPAQLSRRGILRHLGLRHRRPQLPDQAASAGPSPRAADRGAACRPRSQGTTGFLGICGAGAVGVGRPLAAGPAVDRAQVRRAIQPRRDRSDPGLYGAEQSLPPPAREAPVPGALPGKARII